MILNMQKLLQYLLEEKMRHNFKSQESLNAFDRKFFNNEEEKATIVASKVMHKVFTDYNLIIERKYINFSRFLVIEEK